MLAFAIAVPGLAQTISDDSGTRLTASEKRALDALLEVRIADASSLRLRKLFRAGDGFYCGEMNARTRSGSYGGFVPFYLDLTTGQVSVPPAGKPVLRAIALSDIRRRCGGG
jgi:hypothetical protein